MADKEVIFIAFAIEDEGQRNLLTGQSLHTKCSIEYIDYSVKTAYESDWKDKVRTRIRRSAGVIVLVSKNSLTSTGQKWEIECAKEEKKPIYAIWAYSNDSTTLTTVSAKKWTWDGITNFIDGLA